MNFYANLECKPALNINCTATQMLWRLIEKSFRPGAGRIHFVYLTLPPLSPYLCCGFGKLAATNQGARGEGIDLRSVTWAVEILGVLLLLKRRSEKQWRRRTTANNERRQQTTINNYRRRTSDGFTFERRGRGGLILSINRRGKQQTARLCTLS